MSYKVGQILYVVPTKQTAVYPMQVVEEITKKTLKGVEVDYVLRSGGSDPKLIYHKDIQGEIFESSEKVNSVLTDRAIKSIMRLVDTAQRKAKEWYPTTLEQDDDSLSKENHETQQSESVITLEDGTIARVRLPDILKSLYLHT